MKPSSKQFISRRVIICEISAFVFIIIIVWLNELIDIPHLLFGTERTPINWIESLFESILIAVIGAAEVYITLKSFKRMKYLEGMLPVCSSCKKVRDADGAWHQIEAYIHGRSDAKFSHGICPECAEKLYPEFNPYKKRKPVKPTNENTLT